MRDPSHAAWARPGRFRFRSDRHGLGRALPGRGLGCVTQAAPRQGAMGRALGLVRDLGRAQATHDAA